MELDSNQVALVFSAIEKEDGDYIALDLYTDLDDSSDMNSPEGIAFAEAIKSATALRFLANHPEIEQMYMKWFQEQAQNGSSLDMWTETVGRA